VLRDYFKGNLQYSLPEIEALPDGLDGVYVENFGRILMKNIALFTKIKSLLALLVAMLEPLSVQLCQLLIDCTAEEMTEITHNLCYLFPVVDGRFTVYHKSVVDFLTDRKKSQKLNDKGEITEYLLMERFSLKEWGFTPSQVKTIYDTLRSKNITTVQMIRLCDSDDLKDLFPDNKMYAKTLMDLISALNAGELAISKYFYDYYSDKKQGHVLLSRRLISLFMRTDSPLSMASLISIECPEGISSDYLYGHLVDHLVQGGLLDEAKFLLLHIHWSIGVLQNRSNPVIDLQKQYQLAMSNHSDIPNLNESLKLCHKSMVMSSSFISSHYENKTKLINSFVLNQIGRLRRCELAKIENSPLQLYIKECCDWWSICHSYFPHMYESTSPEGKILF
jgi:hypothetical protein